MSTTSGLLLSVDQGTTNTKAALVNRSGAAVFRTSVPVSLLQPQPGFVETDPLALWASVQYVMRSCATRAQQLEHAIEGICISNQRETAVCWQANDSDSHAVPAALGSAISWQCRRSASVCNDLRTHSARIQQITGLQLDPLLTAGKWNWALTQDASVASAAKDGTLRLGTVDSWLLFCLTGGHAHGTDPSNASRTGLLDLQSLTWSEVLLKLFGIPASSLPALHPTASTFGLCSTIDELAGVPIVAIVGDSHASMAGHGSYTAGSVKATYGTGSSLMTLAAELPAGSAHLARTIAWSTTYGVQFALEGNIAMTGSAVQWMGEVLGFADPAAEAAELADTVAGAEGMYFVPAMVGLGAPYWDAAARGTLTGMERSHTRAHFARAAVDSIALQVADVFFAMESELGITLPALRADGGATRNSSLLQFQADILGRPVLRSTNEDLSMLGAAALGGLTLGWWSSLDEFATLAPGSEKFVPTMKEEERQAIYRGWHAAVARTRSGAQGVRA